MRSMRRPLRTGTPLARTKISNRKSAWALTLLAATFLIAPSAASAGLMDQGGGDITVVPLYRALVFGGVDRDRVADPGIASEDIFGIDYVSNTTVLPVANASGSVTANGATFTGIGQSASSGFFAARNYAQITVSNANPNDSYLLTAGQGSASSVRFFTPDAQAQRAIFTFRVTGTESISGGLGAASGRLDFGATTDTGVNWLDLFINPTGPINSITRFGPGLYTYVLPIADLGVTINLFYWSSAFGIVNSGFLSDVGINSDVPAGSNVALTANYSNTFLLENVQLLGENDNPVSEWELFDLNLGETVFNQDGRLAAILPAPELPTPPSAVPEPSVLLLLLAGFAAMQMRRRG